MTLDSINASLLSAVLGAMAAGLFGMLADQRRRHREKLSIANAFKGEIQALLTKVGHRKYVENLRKFAQSDTFLEIPVKEKYFEVYKSNCSRIGLLPAELTVDIATFYIFAKAFVEDARSYCKKPLSSREYTTQYNRMADMLESIRQIGERVIQNVNKLNRK